MKKDHSSKNICIILAYDGSDFLGWQANEQRDGVISVQECLEQTLYQVTGEPVELTGAGRTDRGVHARGQAANFYTSCSMSLEELREKTNELLPESLRVTGIRQVPAHFHSRYDAMWKEYRYRIAFGDKPSVFHRNYVYHCPCCPDVTAMKEAAELLTGEQDYRGFSSVKDPDKNTVRRVFEIRIEEKEHQELELIFRGEGFLYNMVRILSGTLLEVGRGRMRQKQIRRVLENGDRELAGPTLPPQGLTLEKIEYKE